MARGSKVYVLDTVCTCRRLLISQSSLALLHQATVISDLPPNELQKISGCKQYSAASFHNLVAVRGKSDFSGISL